MAATSRAPRSRGAPSSASTAASAAPPYGSASPAASSGGGAERGEHAGAAVVGGGAAEPDHDLARPALDRGGDQQAQPVRRGGLRVALGGGEQVQPAGLGALQVGGVAVGGEQDLAGGRTAERVDGRHRHPPAAERRGEHVDEARARRRRAAGAAGRRRRRRSRQPAATAAATSGAGRVPANLSGQISTRMPCSVAAHIDGGCAVPALWDDGARDVDLG